MTQATLQEYSACTTLLSLVKGASQSSHKIKPEEIMRGESHGQYRYGAFSRHCYTLVVCHRSLLLALKAFDYEP
jgi:hypothetical protein